MVAKTEAIARQELHGFIDILPERSIPAVKSLLEVLTDDYWKPVIETDLTESEKASIKKTIKRYKTHPEEFITLDELKKEYAKEI